MIRNVQKIIMTVGNYPLIVFIFDRKMSEIEKISQIEI